MPLLIEMVSDVVCPWCWLGLRRLKAAAEMTPEIELELAFRPFELDPGVPAGGYNYKDYMQQRFSSEESKSKMSAMRTALEQYGAAEGVPFNFEAISRRPNSFNAHRLIFWAQGQGKGIEAKEALFEAYFSKGQDIGDHEVLITIASQVGLDPNIISDLLATDADVDTLREQMQLFRGMGINGVPTYVAHRHMAAQGAETPERLAQFLRAAAQHGALAQPAS